MCQSDVICRQVVLYDSEKEKAEKAFDDAVNLEVLVGLSPLLLTVFLHNQTE